MFVWNGVGWWCFLGIEFHPDEQRPSAYIYIYRQVKAVKKALKVGVNFRQHRKTKDGRRGKGSPMWVVGSFQMCIFSMSSMIYPKSIRFGHNLIAATSLVYVCSHFDIVMTIALVLSVLFGDLLWSVFFSWAGKAPGNLTGFFLDLFLVIVCLNNPQYTSFSQLLTFNFFGDYIFMYKKWSSNFFFHKWSVPPKKTAQSKLYKSSWNPLGSRKMIWTSLARSNVPMLFPRYGMRLPKAPLRRSIRWGIFRWDLFGILTLAGFGTPPRGSQWQGL